MLRIIHRLRCLSLAVFAETQLAEKVSQLEQEEAKTRKSMHDGNSLPFVNSLSLSLYRFLSLCIDLLSLYRFRLSVTFASHCAVLFSLSVVSLSLYPVSFFSLYLVSLYSFPPFV